MNVPQPRVTALLGLLVLLPLGVYWYGTIGLPTALAAACVVLIVGSLWTMLSPDEPTNGTAH